MNKKFLIGVLSCSLLVGGVSTMLVGCSNNELVIEKLDRKEYFDTEDLTLNALLGNDKAGSKVKWTSSNPEIARIINSQVLFKTVSAKSCVTFTATVIGDEKKTDSVTIDVLPSIVDLKNSSGEIDTSKLLSEGTVKVDSKTDNSLIISSVYGNYFYTESTITIDSIDSSVAEPRVGYVVNSNYNGVYNDPISKKGAGYLCFNAKGISATTGSKKFEFASNGDDMTAWNFYQKGFESDNEIKIGDSFKLGLLKAGNSFIGYVGNATDTVLKPYMTFEYYGITSGTSIYSFLVGSGVGYTVKDIKTIDNGAILNNSYMNNEPTMLNVSNESLELKAGRGAFLLANVDIPNYNTDLFSFTTNENQFFSIQQSGSACVVRSASKYVVEDSEGKEVTKPIDITYNDVITVSYNNLLTKTINVTISPVDAE